MKNKPTLLKQVINYHMRTALPAIMDRYQEKLRKPVRIQFNTKTIYYSETKFGFEWGAALVERCFSDKKKGWVTLLLKTKKHPNGLQIYVTKTGKVRIHGNDSKEWKPV